MAKRRRKEKEVAQMSKLQEHPTTERTHEELPELPESVVVPDDISSLKFPTSIEHRRTATGVRWMPWVAALIVIAMVGALVGTFVVRDSGTETVIRARSYELVQQSIDEAPAATRAATIEQVSPYGTWFQSSDQDVR
jgi:hypothetical protein